MYTARMVLVQRRVRNYFVIQSCRPDELDHKVPISMIYFTARVNINNTLRTIGRVKSADKLGTMYFTYIEGHEYTGFLRKLC